MRIRRPSPMSPFAARLKPDSTVSVPRFTTSNDWTATGYALYLVYGQLGCQISANGVYHNFQPSGPDLRDGRFHHVAVSVDRDSPTGGHLYVDGVSIYTFDPTVAQGDLS